MSKKSLARSTSRDITASGDTITCYGFELRRSGMVPIGEPSYDDWERCGLWLNNMDKSVQFWLGDWINYGESRYGEKYAQALDMTEYSYSYLRQVAYVADKVQMLDRSNKLGFRHHYEVAGLERDEQIKFLRLAEEEGLSAKELRRRIKREYGVFRRYVECPYCNRVFCLDDTTIFEERGEE